MAWSGTPVITSLSKYTVRITGVFLDVEASGTIGVPGSGAEIVLPSTFPATIDGPAAQRGLTMSDIVRYVQNGPGDGSESLHIHFIKQASPFLITVQNDDENLRATGPLEMYVQYFHSLIR